MQRLNCETNYTWKAAEWLVDWPTWGTDDTDQLMMSSCFCDSQSQALCNGEQCDAVITHKLATVCPTLPYAAVLFHILLPRQRFSSFFSIYTRLGWHLLSASEGILMSVQLPLSVFSFLSALFSRHQWPVLGTFGMINIESYCTSSWTVQRGRNFSSHLFFLLRLFNQGCTKSSFRFLYFFVSSV